MFLVLGSWFWLLAGQQRTKNISSTKNKEPRTKNQEPRTKNQEPGSGGSNAEFTKFLRYSQRSCSEVQSQLYVALDQSYITQEKFDSIYNQAALTHGKVGGFIRYLLNTLNPR